MDENLHVTEQELEEALRDTMMETIGCYETQTTGSATRKAEAENLTKVVDAYSKLVQTREDVTDKIERRRIEEEKNATNAEIEAEKARVPWERIIVEMIGSFGRQITDHIFFGIRQREILTFEETGMIRSKASRDVSFRFPWTKK